MKKSRYQRTADGWQTQPRDPVSGRRITLTGKTPEELDRALQRIREARQDLRLGASREQVAERLQPTRVKILVEDIWSTYMAGVSERSRVVVAQTWERRLAPTFAKKCPWELDVPTLRNWAVDLQERGYAMKTIMLAYGLLSAAYNVAAIPGIVPYFPWGKWRPPHPTGDERFIPLRPACTTVEEFKALTMAASAEDEHQWKRGHYADSATLVMVMGLTGLRQGETAGLAWDCLQIDSEPAVIHVRYQAKRGWKNRSTKEGRPTDDPKDGPRRLVLHRTAAGVLRQQRDELKRRGWYHDDGPVFPERGGRWSQTGRILDSRRLKRWAKEAKLPRADEWCAHSLRHTFCTLELFFHGGDLKSVMARSGHAEVRAMQGYIHAAGGAMPVSRIPELEMAQLMPSLPAAGHAVPEPTVPTYGTTPMMGETVSGLLVGVQERRELVERERDELKRKQKTRARESFELIAERWSGARCPGERPSEIDAGMRLAYSRAYSKAKHSGKDARQCLVAAKRARGHHLGAWLTAWRRWSRVHCSAVEATT
jgi:integrase